MQILLNQHENHKMILLCWLGVGIAKPVKGYQRVN
jgi:hypothetical protein